MQKKEKKKENYEDLAKICDGLSHPFRFMIVETLSKNNNRMLLSKLERSFLNTPHYRQWNIVKAHVMRMANKGIVELTKDENGQFLVILKKKVEIHVEDVNCLCRREVSIQKGGDESR